MPYRPSAILLLTAALTASLAGCSGGGTTLQWDVPRAAGAVGSSPAETVSPAPAVTPPSTVLAAQGVAFWEPSARLPDGTTGVDAQPQGISRGSGRQDTSLPGPQPTPSVTGPSEAATTPAGDQPCADPAVLMDGVCDEPASHVS